MLFFNSSVIGISIPRSMIYAMMMNAQSLFYYSLGREYSEIAEVNLFKNFSPFTTYLANA